MTLRLRVLTALALLGLAVAPAGCGGDDNSSTTSQTQTTATTPTQTTPEETGRTEAQKVKPGAGEANLDRKPKVPRGKGSPPSKLVVQDLIVGKGKEAKQGSSVSVQYVGVLFDDGNEFDASWRGKKPGRAFAFQLGASQVIPGWDQGVVGMKVGGRRKVIVPPDLAYGAQGFPPDIPPNSTLIFDVDLQKVSG